jgi:type I restriction enzyme S subunit
VTRTTTLLDALSTAEVFVDGDWVESKDQDAEGDVRLIQLADVGDGYYVNKSNRFLTSTAAKRLKCTFLERGDVLIARMPDPLGRACIFPGDMKRAVTVVDVCIIRVDPVKMFAPWLVHCINSSINRNQIAGYITGTTRQRISRGNLGKIEITLPSLPEQRRIAAILDQADALRAKRREALAQLDSLAQSIFNEMFGELSTNSKGWKTCKVGDISDCIVPGRDKPKSFSGSIPWVTTADLQHLELTLGSTKKIGLSDAEIENVRARVIPSGSVIISCVGDLGIVSIAEIPMVVNQQLHSFQCHSDMNNVFLMYCLALQKPFMLAKASSTTLPYMNKTVCNSIPVVIPPMVLQQTFAARIQVIETLKSTHRLSLTHLDSLFASLQQRAFRGEL